MAEREALDVGTGNGSGPPPGVTPARAAMLGLVQGPAELLPVSRT